MRFVVKKPPEMPLVTMLSALAVFQLAGCGRGQSSLAVVEEQEGITSGAELLTPMPVHSERTQHMSDIQWLERLPPPEEECPTIDEARRGECPLGPDCVIEHEVGENKILVQVQCSPGANSSMEAWYLHDAGLDSDRVLRFRSPVFGDDAKPTRFVRLDTIGGSFPSFDPERRTLINWRRGGPDGPFRGVVYRFDDSADEFLLACTTYARTGVDLEKPVLGFHDPAVMKVCPPAM